jgi:hypothetical protein
MKKFVIVALIILLTSFAAGKNGQGLFEVMSEPLSVRFV